MFVMCVLVSSAQARLYSGAGTEGDPFIIDSPETLNDIGLNQADWDKHFELIADVNMVDYTGESFNMIGYYVGLGSTDNVPFTGVFDGNGHTISSFTYISNATERIYCMGLFRYVDGVSSEIKGLGLIDPHFVADTAWSVGALVGQLDSGTISNCYIEGGSVSGNFKVGGMVGDIHYIGGTISNCHATCSVSAHESVASPAEGTVGGLVGKNGGDKSYGIGTVSNCYATGDISGNVPNCGGLVGINAGQILGSYATGNIGGEGSTRGGLVGYNLGDQHRYGIIINCYATGNINGNVGNKNNFGGLAGLNSGEISKSHASGNVAGIDSVGGLVGKNVAGDNGFGLIAIGDISECYSLGDVTDGRYPLGGLVGENNGGTITNCYAMGNVEGSDWNGVGGLVGENLANGTISKCYSTGHVPDGFIQNNIGGFVGENEAGSTVSNSFWDTETSGWDVSNGGTGKTTAQMQAMSTFTNAGWDYSTPVWKQCSGKPMYPKLAWQEFLVGDYVDPVGVVDIADFAFLASYWHDSGLGMCGGADLTGDGVVDANDLLVFSEYWLQGIVLEELDEDFETGDFSKYEWQGDGDPNWTVVSSGAYEGSYCAKSASIGNDQQTTLQITIDSAATNINFYQKVSSEPGFDELVFYVDDVQQGAWSGDMDWGYETYTITPGEHTFKWVYKKDDWVGQFSDSAWIDKITLAN